MPLEIKELHIKVAVDSASGPSGGNNASASGNGSASSGGGEPDPATVAACVEKVLEILAKKMER